MLIFFKDKNTGTAKSDETVLEGLSGICSVLVVGLFVLYFLAQNFVIPSGSMENTLLVGDHLVVDRITLAPPSKWMPLVHYREPKRNDILVFIKPGTIDADGKPSIMFLVKRLIGVPGDHIHLRDGVVYINGEAIPQPHAQPTTPGNFSEFLDNFPSVPPVGDGDPTNGTPDVWANEFPTHIENGDLVVPPGMFFMMGDHRHSSLDSRYWGFVPRQNIVGRPLFNYWSFKSSEARLEKIGFMNQVSWIGHVVLHFLSDTRWSRTLRRVE